MSLPRFVKFRLGSAVLAASAGYFAYPRGSNQLLCGHAVQPGRDGERRTDCEG